MQVDLVFVCWNRLDYTRLSLESILSDPTEEFQLTIWDNGSTDGTVEYLRREVDDPRIKDIVLSKENVGQIAAVNAIWSRSKADLLGKLDNDCLMMPGWTRTLAQAHADIEELGVVACWHYPLDEFDETRARRAGKVQTFGRHQILRHPWTCGTGLLVKRDTYHRFGPLQGNGTTQYWLRMALAGYVNGFYYPLIPQEHMDDPRSSHCLFKTDRELQQYKDISVVLKEHGITTMEARWRRRAQVLHNLNAEPWQAEYYVGWRRRLRRVRHMIRRLVTGRDY